jgi:hypothetical protein
MSGRPEIAAGGCQCGAVRYAFHAEPSHAHACHCRMCQRAVGGAFALLVGAHKENFAWTKGQPKFFASSNLADRGFCDACGTPLSFAYVRPTSRIFVTMGSLDAPDAFAIGKHFGVESRWGWVKFCEDVEAEETGAGDLAPDIVAFFAAMKSNQG